MELSGEGVGSEPEEFLDLRGAVITQVPLFVLEYFLSGCPASQFFKGLFHNACLGEEAARGGISIPITFCLIVNKHG